MKNNENKRAWKVVVGTVFFIIVIFLIHVLFNPQNDEINKLILIVVLLFCFIFMVFVSYDYKEYVNPLDDNKTIFRHEVTAFWYFWISLIILIVQVFLLDGNTINEDTIKDCIGLIPQTFLLAIAFSSVSWEKLFNYTKKDIKSNTELRIESHVKTYIEHTTSDDKSNIRVVECLESEYSKIYYTAGKNNAGESIDPQCEDSSHNDEEKQEETSK